MIQPEASSSPRTRRRWPYVVAVLMVIGIVTLALSGWSMYQQHLLLPELRKSYTVENNPWGLEEGMTIDQARTAMAQEYFIKQFDTSADLWQFYRFDYEGYDFEVLLDFDPDPNQIFRIKSIRVQRLNLEHTSATDWLRE